LFPWKDDVVLVVVSSAVLLTRGLVSGCSLGVKPMVVFALSLP